VSTLSARGVKRPDTIAGEDHKKRLNIFSRRRTIPPKNPLIGVATGFRPTCTFIRWEKTTEGGEEFESGGRVSSITAHLRRNYLNGVFGPSGERTEFPTRPREGTRVVGGWLRQDVQRVPWPGAQNAARRPIKLAKKRRISPNNDVYVKTRQWKIYTETGTG